MSIKEKNIPILQVFGKEDIEAFKMVLRVADNTLHLKNLSDNFPGIQKEDWDKLRKKIKEMLRTLRMGGGVE